ALEWTVSIGPGGSCANLDEEVGEQAGALKESIVNWEPVDIDDNVYQQAVDNRLSYVYPYQQAAHARAKQTVTEIKRQREVKDEYSSDQLVQKFQSPIVKRPVFMQKQQTITASERGT